MERAENAVSLIRRAAGFFLRRLGYDLYVYKRADRRYQEDFSTQSIFDYFPYWHSKLIVDGQAYGGDVDYTTERTSVLNVMALYDHVDFRGKSVIELGPLEGGNTTKLCEAGAARVLAVEGRVENYVKCCVLRNLHDLENARYVLDDAMHVTRERYGQFDIAFCAGLLYHLDRPDLMIRQLAEVADTLVLATHYADEASPSPTAEVREIESGGSTYRTKAYREGPIQDPNSGLQPYSLWLFEDDLLRCCRDAGYSRVDVILRNPVAEERYKLIYLVAKK